MQSSFHESLAQANGPIRYNMTNDYMFRYILQKNKKVLKGLISSLLHLNPNEISSIEIMNPINLSDDVVGKDFILDIDILMNNDTRINLEMQVSNKLNWPDRSLSYICRSFDQLYKGNQYDEALPVIHIGFLDFTLFPNYPEFYSSHMLLNVKNYHLFSSKFKLSMVDLSKIELATEEDKAYQIDYWARLFKAKTWEEIKMLVKDNEYIQEAVHSIYMANADELVRQKCLAREEAERHERTMLRDLQILENKTIKLEKERALLENKTAALRAEKSALEDITSALEDKNSALEDKNSALEKELAALKEKLASMNL